MNSPVTAAGPVRPMLPAGDPRIVGIVNITEDSFSDGGRYLDPEAAIVHARRLRGEGADVVELGPAASHPGSAPVTAREEQRRLASVLEQLAADGIPVSVDSSRPQTQRFAIAAGVAYLNDIHGFGDPDMYPALAASECQLIVMHAIQSAGSATRVVTDSAAVWDGTRRFFAVRLAALREAGISRDRLIIDPGLGYFLGSTPGPSLAALAGIRELKATFGVHVLASPSRKSFPVWAGDACCGDLRRVAGSRLRPHPRRRRRTRRVHRAGGHRTRGRKVVIEILSDTLYETMN
jgi:dihydropteroate synthase type 2